MSWLNTTARRLEQVQVALSSAAAAETVLGSFSGLTWTDVPGPGDLNKQLRSLRDTGPTLSVDVEELEGGGSNIKLWMSDWTTQNGAILGSNHVIVKKRKILRRLLQQV